MMSYKTSLIAGAFVLMCGVHANAADLLKPSAAVIPTPQVEAPDYNRATWSGAYIEAGLGMSVGQVEVGIVGKGPLATLSDSAIVGHVGIGYDHMIMPHVVVGILGRAQIDEVNHKLDGESLAGTDITYVAAGRIGWVPRNDAMIYVLAGGSWSGLDFKGADAPNGTSRFGWVFGGGVELMLTDHIGVGLEYTATMYDSDKIVVDEATSANLESTDHAGKARVLFKF